MNLQCIVLLHQHDQTTVNLPPAVGGLRHLATNILIHLRRGLASKKQNILVRKISQYLEYPRQKCGAWGGQGLANEKAMMSTFSTKDTYYH